jgi:hypothetical protein
MDSVNHTPQGAGGDDASLAPRNNGDAPSDSGSAGNNAQPASTGLNVPSDGSEAFDAAGDTSTSAATSVADVLPAAQNAGSEEEDTCENYELHPAAVGTAARASLSQITDEAPVHFSHVSSAFEDGDKKLLASQRTSRSPEIDQIDEAPVHFSHVSSDFEDDDKKMQANQRTSSGPQIDQVDEASNPFDNATVVEQETSIDQAISNDTSLASVQNLRTTITTFPSTLSDNSAAARRPSVASLPLLRATVVEEPTDPVFEGVQVAPDEPLPWWKRHQLLLSLVVVLLMAVIVSAAIASTKGDRKLEPTSPSSDETSFAIPSDRPSMQTSFCGTYRVAPRGTLLGCDYCFHSVDMDKNNDVVIGASESSNEDIQFLTYGDGKTGDRVALKLNSSIASVAISGDAAVAGTLYGSSTLAYIFEMDSLGMWNQVMQVDPDYVDENFGRNVDIDEDVIVIGNQGDGANGGGSAFVYRRVNGTWLQEAKLVPDDSLHDFGQSVSVKGDLIAVGDAFYGGTYQGAVFVYEYDSESKSWIQLTDPITNDDCDLFFGSVVKLTEDNVLMIGCYVGDEKSTGVVYSYSLSGEGDQYELQQAILPSEKGAKNFGEIDRIAVDANFMLVTANLNQQVFLFARENNLWKEVAVIYAPDSTDTNFGHSLALSGRTALVSSGENVYSYFIEDC